MILYIVTDVVVTIILETIGEDRMRETYDEMLERHKQEIEARKEQCESHAIMACSARSSPGIWSGSNPYIKVYCKWCGKNSVILGAEEHTEKIIDAINSGKIKLDLSKLQYRMDYWLFVNEPKDDYNFIMNQLEEKC